MGAALLTLPCFGFPAPQSGDILNDLTATTAGELTGSYLAQDFLANAGGGIVGVTLDLNFSAGASPLGVYLYNSLGSGPTTPFTGFSYFGLLGTITPTGAGAQDYTVNLINSFGVTSGQYYSILIDTTLATGTVAWEYATASDAAAANSANSATGTFLQAYQYNGVSWTALVGGDLGSPTFQLEVVPEPSTTAFIGFGGVALILVQRLRRKKI